MHPKRLHRRPIAQFRQRAVMKQRPGNVVGDRFVVGQIGRALAGDDGGELSSESPRRSPAMTWA